MVGVRANRAFCPGPLPPAVVRPQGKRCSPNGPQGWQTRVPCSDFTRGYLSSWPGVLRNQFVDLLSCGTSFLRSVFRTPLTLQQDTTSLFSKKKKDTLLTCISIYVWITSPNIQVPLPWCIVFLWGLFSLIHKSLQILNPKIGNSQVSGPSCILDESALSRTHLE